VDGITLQGDELTTSLENGYYEFSSVKSNHTIEISFISQTYNITYFDENGELDKSKLDPCFIDALRFVVSEQKASVAFIQRKLQIGYSKAAQIIDMMEELDFISDSNTLPRIVFITKDEFMQIFEKAS
jgi:S-DNA-T family DNA segregation ATPase FtsK/SpoIIIE